MAKVFEIAISRNFKGKMIGIPSVEAVANKGLVNDRKFKENNEKKSQLTLIEIENINYYNKTTSSAVDPLNFRRNIITEGIELNKLINKEFSIGNIKVKAHDLCRPCKYLQELLNQKNFVKELLLKAGLRCEILTTGKISIGDIIKTYD